VTDEKKFNDILSEINNLLGVKNYENIINANFPNDLQNIENQNKFSKIYLNFSSYNASLILNSVLDANAIPKQNLTITKDIAVNKINTIISELKSDIIGLRDDDQFYLLTKLNNYLRSLSINSQSFVSYKLDEINLDVKRTQIMTTIFKGIFKGGSVDKINFDYSVKTMKSSLEFLKFCYYCINLIAMNTFNLN
jgi:hypothetical protein